MKAKVGNNQELQSVNHVTNGVPEHFTMAFRTGMKTAAIVMKIEHIKQPDMTDYQQQVERCDHDRCPRLAGNDGE